MFQGMEYVYEVYKRKKLFKGSCQAFYFPAVFKRQCKACGKKGRLSLFDRSTKPLGLTECGKEYIRCVEEIRVSRKVFLILSMTLEIWTLVILPLEAAIFFLPGSCPR